ncbi:50S ribosomal protein L24e [Candidatus Pacearchaeota archaeon]|nr:50S ribosomal protein L24e [Candidatus Pacearchaeota archaeon]
MVKCFFCGDERPAHTGIHYIKNDGTIQFFCSSKCRKNTLKLGRDKRKIKWTALYAESRDKAKAKLAALKVAPVVQKAK